MAGYQNGGLTTAQIKEMQRYYGTTADGMWGDNSTAAAGGRNAANAWRAYQANKGTGSSGSSGGSNSGSSGSGGSYSGGYNNGGLTADQVRQMQAYYGTTADGLWGANSTAAAGGLSASDAWNAYREAQAQDELNADMSWEKWLDSMGGNDYEARLREAVNAQVQQAVNDYNSQIEQAGTSYEDAARRAYISKMLSRRNMDQELAASGVYGGAADSQKIAAEADYQNNLTDLETQYNDTIAQLKQAITAARLSGDAQIAEQMASYLSQVQSEYRSYLQEQMAARQQSGGGTASYSSSGGGGTTTTQEQSSGSNYRNTQAYERAVAYAKAGAQSRRTANLLSGFVKNGQITSAQAQQIMDELY